MQGVEGVEELLLRLHLAGKELDVVDEQHVDVAIKTLERARAVIADRVDELVGELFRVDVADPEPRVDLADIVTDGVQQVGLAQSRGAIDEQRVVGLGRRLGDRVGGRVGEPVARASDKRVEGVFRVESAAIGVGVPSREGNHPWRMPPASSSAVAAAVAGAPVASHPVAVGVESFKSGGIERGIRAIAALTRVGATVAGVG